MRSSLPLFALLLLYTPLAFGQEVIGSTGGNLSAGSVIVSQTVGEPVVGRLSDGVTIDQGFHQSQILITSVSIEDDAISVNVYPNPFSEQVRIDGSSAIRTLELFDTAGKLVWHKAAAGGLTTMTIDLAAFQAGQYILRVNGAGNTYQLIKQ